MSNYIPWFGKKRARLVKHEREFLGLLEAGAEAGKIAEMAEEVRAAKIRVLRAQRARLAPAESRSAAIERFDREMERWALMANEAIVDAYRAKLDRHGPKPRMSRRGSAASSPSPPP